MLCMMILHFQVKFICGARFVALQYHRAFCFSPTARRLVQSKFVFAEIHMSASIDVDDKRVRCRTSTERVGLPVRKHVGLSVGCTCREDCCSLHTSRELFGLTPPPDSSDPRRRSQHGHESTEAAAKAASGGAEHLK